MPILTGAGNYQYNGFTFPGSPLSEISARLLYDESGRVVVATVYELSISCIIQNNSGTDADLIDLRRRLEKPGQALLFESNGFGGMTINSGNVKDVLWGPKPRVLLWRILGPDRAIWCRWTCEVAIPECTGATYSRAIMAFCYGCDFSIDSDGYQTRTYSGYFQIAQTRTADGGRTVQDTADAYWERVQPQLPAGFRRVSRDRKISYDKSRCDFTIIDEQIPGGAFPEGVTYADGRHFVRNEPNNMVRYQATLEATYHLAAGAQKAKALDAFWMLLLDRTRAGRGLAPGNPFGFQGPPNPLVNPVTNAQAAVQAEANSPVSGGSVIMNNFTSEEGLYNGSRRVSFSAGWTYTSTVADCIRDGGQWRAVPGTNHQQWLTSAGVREALDPRGTARLRLDAADDLLIDLCDASAVRSLTATAQQERSLRNFQETQQRSLKSINPDNSWLAFNCNLRIHRRANKVVLKKLPLRDLRSTVQPFGQAPIQPTAAGAQATAQAVAQLLGPNSAIGRMVNDQVTEKDVVQQRATASYQVVMEGYAIRADHECPVPKLAKIGGVDVEELDAYADRGILDNWDGHPIFYSRWGFVFAAKEPPSKEDILSLPNPAAGFGEGAQSG